MPLMTRAQASPFRTTTVQLILITSINAGRFDLRECVGAATRHVSLPSLSPPPPAIFSLAARLLRVEMKIYVSAGCIRQFLPSPFFRTFTYSRGFIVGLDLYRKLNGEMKNRGKKLQVLNSEKCDEITRNVCTFRNIRVTAKGKRENIFFHFICMYIYFFLEEAG